MAGRTRLWFTRRFTTHLFNPGSLLFFGRLPGCGILIHIGRTSGRRYRVPIFVLRRGDDYVFALTYGSESDWVKNILAAGGCEMRARGRDVRLVEPEVFVDQTRRLMPLPYRLAGRAVHATEFLSMRAAPITRGPAVRPSERTSPDGHEVFRSLLAVVFSVGRPRPTKSGTRTSRGGSPS